MGKRKLNKRQRHRIADHQTALSNAAADGQLERGLVVTHFGKEVEVVAMDDANTCDFSQKVRCHFRANLPTIVCGDRILWRKPNAGEDLGVIEALLERESVLERPRPYQDPKPVAANIDQIFIVIAPQPEPITTLIDRYLIAAENANIHVSLILNKTDLFENGDETAINQEIQNILTLYPQLGYPVFQYSVVEKSPDGQRDILLDRATAKCQLTEALADNTSILVGQSGVGKSSIINSLTATDVAQTGDISDATDKGRHTTTTAQLYNIRNEHDLLLGSIIDSPGIREFGLWHLGIDDIINGLPEFQRAASHCKFRDCQHGHSNGCALQAAFDNGDIHRSRISSYQHILNSRDS